MKIDIDTKNNPFQVIIVVDGYAAQANIPKDVWDMLTLKNKAKAIENVIKRAKT